MFQSLFYQIPERHRNLVLLVYWQHPGWSLERAISWFYATVYFGIQEANRINRFWRYQEQISNSQSKLEDLIA